MVQSRDATIRYAVDATYRISLHNYRTDYPNPFKALSNASGTLLGPIQDTIEFPASLRNGPSEPRLGDNPTCI